MTFKTNLKWYAIAIGLTVVIYIVLVALVRNPQILPPLTYLFTDSFLDLSRYALGEPRNYGTAFMVLLDNALVSMGRILAGLIPAVVLGVYLPLQAANHIKRLGIVSWVIRLARSLPFLILIPLFLYWFGHGVEFGMSLYIGLGGFIIVSSVAYQAIGNVRDNVVSHVQVLGASPSFLKHHIYFPAILPDIRAGLVDLIGLVWAFSLGAEYLSATKGLGFLVSQMYSNSLMNQIVLISIWYIFLSTILYALLNYLLSKLAAQYRT